MSVLPSTRMGSASEPALANAGTAPRPRGPWRDTMARRIVILLSVLLLAGVASAQITTERDNTPPLVAVTFPGPCSMHLDTPTNVTGIAYDPETGISDLRVWLVRDATGENAHDWENWNGLQWVPVVLIEDSVALPVQLHTETSTWITTGQMPSVGGPHPGLQREGAHLRPRDERPRARLRLDLLLHGREDGARAHAARRLIVSPDRRKAWRHPTGIGTAKAARPCRVHVTRVARVERPWRPQRPSRGCCRVSVTARRAAAAISRRAPRPSCGRW